MTNFTELKEEYLPLDGVWIKIDGTLTEEDIQKINSFVKKSISYW